MGVYLHRKLWRFYPSCSRKVIKENLTVCSVLSDRNFEARIHPNIKMNFLMSPMFVIIYSIIGKINNPLSDKISEDKNGNSIFLKDLWPKNSEIEKIMKEVVNKNQFKKTYSKIFHGDKNWEKLKVEKSALYKWDKESTYIKEVSFFKSKNHIDQKNINARILLNLGDSVTTDHISPAGKFSKMNLQVKPIRKGFRFKSI